MKSKFFNYSKNENLTKFSQELSPQDYYNSYLGMFYFCLVLTFISQILSLGSEYSYFSQVFSSSLNGVLLVGATVLFCIFIESAKYFVFGAFFKQMFLLTKSSVNPFLLILALFISAVSVYASVIGGGTFGIDTAKVASTESKHDAEITTLRKEIAEIHQRNTWKGNTYIAGEDKALLHTKESELSKAKQQKESELQTVATQNKESELTYRYWFGGFELVFVLCTWFSFYFRKRTTIESKTGAEAVPSDSDTISHVGYQIPQQGNHATGNVKKLGFSFGNTHDSNPQVNNLSVSNPQVKQVHIGDEIACEYCQSKFIKKTLLHRFCSKSCKLAWHKENTGFDLKLHRKKGATK